MTRIVSFYRFLIYILPVTLFFSYYPVIGLGGNDTMNFELSLPLLWLLIFDIVALFIMTKKKSFKKVQHGWLWLLFPVFVSLSVFWSANFIRGLLTVGILWLIYFAIYAMWALKVVFFKVSYKEIFWKMFFGSSLFVCAWCLLQCILDLAGVPREQSLMCAGCTYKMFGFPHPNGFAIEPQFMGNLLLAPTIVSGWLMFHSRPRPSGPFASGNSRPEGRAPRADGAISRAAALRNAVSLKHYAILFFVFVVALFLTFSRGAIYAFLVAMIFLVVMEWVQQKDWKVCKVFLVIVLAFLFTLNLQGLMAQFSPTNDTYKSGVAKVLNHLSLGVIDIRDDKKNIDDDMLSQNDDENIASEVKDENDAVFDGYVEESTNIRMWLTNAALEIWKKDFKTMFFGVGIGGAGQALYENGLSSAPKEIVQNEYISLLLEVGMVGVILFVLVLVLVICVVWKSTVVSMLMALLAAYMITLLFFSGLPNALHIYLLPVLFMVMIDNKNRKVLLEK